MEITNFKQYSVIVDGGTGVLFQPMTEEYFYILTARHILQNKGEDDTYIDKVDNTSIKVTRFIFENSWKTEEIPFELIKGKTYFPHSNENIDAAILKIRFDEYKKFEIKDLYISENTTINNDTYLCGFPDDKRKANQGNLLEQFTNYTISQNSNDLDFKKSVRLLDHQTQNTIVGMSGGGIVKLKDNYFKLIGIQSQMTKTVSEQNEIDFLPIIYFNEIVTEFSDRLNILLPPYLANFSFVKDKVFNIDAGPDDNDIVFTRNFLKNKANQIINSDITPIGIKDFFKERLVLNNADLATLNDEIIYATWLEFLVIMNIAKNKVHSFSDLEDLFNKVRLIYKNTNSQWQGSDFLKECMNCDLRDLQVNGTVLINTKDIPAKERIGHYKIDKDSIIPSIGTLKKDYQNGNFGDVFIDDAAGEAKEFVFDKYTFIHFEFLKKFLIVEQSEEFKDFDSTNQAELLSKLNSIYGELFSL
ncbi:ABC-three component system protein [Flavobacterium sp. GB2R13]|uniref:ABC-three component system protein n=1 Tax=Flavobacterium algoris TaxID=3398733 RepID=UPI003A83A5A5